MRRLPEARIPSLLLLKGLSPALNAKARERAVSLSYGRDNPYFKCIDAADLLAHDGTREQKYAGLLRMVSDTEPSCHSLARVLADWVPSTDRLRQDMLALLRSNAHDDNREQAICVLRHLEVNWVDALSVDEKWRLRCPESLTFPEDIGKQWTEEPIERSCGN